MLEVKNHKENQPISKEERDKFVKDLDDNAEYNYALLASLNGGFPAKCEELKVTTPKITNTSNEHKSESWNFTTVPVLWDYCLVK